VLRDERGTAMFCMQRAEGAEPFTNDDISEMERQAPHLRRAVQLHRVFAPMRRAAASFTEVLERLPVGVLLTDQAGRVWHRNSAAREIVVRNDGLSLSAGGVLSAGTPLANDRLARLV